MRSLRFALLAICCAAATAAQALPNPVDNTITLAPSNVLDLSLAGIADPAIVKGGGNLNISFCPILSCISTPGDSNVITPSFQDHQRASLLISGTTQDDAHSEEQLLAVTMVTNKKHKRALTGNTAYALGDNVTSGNADYRVVKSGITSISPSLPTGRPNTTQGGNFQVSDGTVLFQWINDASIDGSLPLYVEHSVQPGAGAVWAAAFNLQLAPGVVPTGATGIELDFSNNAATCNIGAANCDAFVISMHGGATNTAGLYEDFGSAAVPGAIWGTRLTGYLTQAAIEVEVSAPYGVAFNGFGNPTDLHQAAIFDNSTGGRTILVTSAANKTVATFEDQSNGPATLAVEGTKTVADILLSGKAPTGIILQGSYSAEQISGQGWSVDPNGTINGFAVLAGNYYTRDSSGALQTGQTCLAGITPNFKVFHGIVVAC